MALNDKLINYGNLSEFRTQIINDASASTVSTWSSSKIASELSGISADAIEDVSVLPDASANKNKFVRLASDKKVYVSECTSEGSEGNPGFAAIQCGVAVYKRYPDADNTNDTEEYSNLQKAWVYVNNSRDLEIEDITDWDDIIVGSYCFTESETPSIGDFGYDYDSDSYNEIYESESNIGYIPPTPATWAWKPLDYQPMISLTYSELKSLRDNKQLVPGQQYRITDYVTTTAQANTQSAGHQFDIIVTADDVNKLNENARAINHIETFAAIGVNYDGELDVLKRYPQGDTNGQYAWAYVIGGVEKTIEEVTDWTIDTEGIALSDSETPSVGDIIDYGGDSVTVTEYEQNISASNDYFANSKLESWELKYCLDNDTNRFSWAQVEREGFAAIVLLDEVYKRYPEGDESHIRQGVDYNIAWVEVNNTLNTPINDVEDWNDINTEVLIWTSTENIVIDETEDYYGDIVEDYSSNAGEVPAGKGVIYYMKDEWNNRVYFDFKNIMIYESSEYEDFCYLFGDTYYGEATSQDGSMAGVCNNNIVEGQVTDGVLTLDTETLLWDKVGYRGEFITINGSTTTLQSFLEGLQPNV